MIIPCYRCGKEISSANASNADYVIAADTIVDEPREVLVALKDNTLTKSMTEEVPQDFYDKVEIETLEDSRGIKDLVGVITEERIKPIQKTGLLCPDCWLPADLVIWGVHKLD